MSLDRFVDQYVGLLQKEIADKRTLLEVKDFGKKSDFTRVQGQLQGLKLALDLLRSIPEED